MQTHRTPHRYLPAVALIAVIAAAVAVVFFRGPAVPDATKARVVDTGTAEPMEPLFARAPPTPTPPPAANVAQPAIEAAILASIADRSAELRALAVRRDASHIACGEKRTARDPRFRRFVWLGHLKMLATDDGSADFERIAAICREGQAIP